MGHHYVTAAKPIIWCGAISSMHHLMRLAVKYASHYFGITLHPDVGVQLLFTISGELAYSVEIVK